MGYEVTEVPLNEILIDHEFNCREEITHSSVFSLASDIEKHGLQQPVSVRPLSAEEANRNPGKKYALVMGFRRTKCYEILGRKTIPAMVKEIDAHDAKILNIGENLHRKDLTFYEEAVSILELHGLGLGRDAIAKTISQSPGWVQRRLQVWQLPKEGIQLVKDGIINSTDIQSLNSYRDPEEQLKIINKIRSDWQLKATRDEDGEMQFKVNVPKPATGKKVNKATHKRTRNKQDMHDLMEFLAAIKFPTGIWTRILAWTAGNITDNELLNDLKEFGSEFYDLEFDMPTTGIPSRSELENAN